MDIQNDDSCILCGKNNEHGLKIKFNMDKEKQMSYAFVKVSKMFNGYNGIVHGGITCALLDEAGFYAIMSQDIITVTMTLNTKFKKPVPIDTDLYLEGQVIEKRSRSVIASSKIMLNGTVLASAVGEYFIKKN